MKTWHKKKELDSDVQTTGPEHDYDAFSNGAYGRQILAISFHRIVRRAGKRLDIDDAGMRRTTLTEAGRTDIERQHIGVAGDIEPVIADGREPCAGGKDHDALPTVLAKGCGRKTRAALVP